MLLSLRKNRLTSLFKEVRVFKVLGAQFVKARLLEKHEGLVAPCG